MESSAKFVGMDVHKESISIAQRIGIAAPGTSGHVLLRVSQIRGARARGVAKLMRS